MVFLETPIIALACYVNILIDLTYGELIRTLSLDFVRVFDCLRRSCHTLSRIWMMKYILPT